MKAALERVALFLLGLVMLPIFLPYVIGRGVLRGWRRSREAQEDAAADAEEERLVAAWCEGRRWVRCDHCATIISQDDPAAHFVVAVEDGRVLNVRCPDCWEPDA